MSDDSRILHALGVLGRCNEARLAEFAQVSMGTAEAAVERLLSGGKLIRGRLGLKLSPAGLEQWKQVLTQECASVDGEKLNEAYRKFIDLNRGFKAWIADYQTAAIKPPVEDLWALHADLVPVLGALSVVLPRFETYALRFMHALEAIESGNLEFVAAPTCASFHTVWFELHEDLILISGRDRSVEEKAETQAHVEHANVLHQISGPAVKWSRVNMAESVIGVQTPLSWSFWDEGGERGFRLGYWQLGLLPRAALNVPDSIDKQFTALFFGQGACNMDAFGSAMAAMPASAAAAETGFFSSRSERLHRGWSRRMLVRAKLPVVAVTLPGRIRHLRTTAEQFWRSATNKGALRNSRGALDALETAMQYFIQAVGLQIVASTLTGLFYGRLQQALARAGLPELETRLIGGYGSMQEIRLTLDLWQIAHGGGSLDAFLQEHGFHGPAEGELSSHSWREQPAPVQSMLKKFAGMRLDAAPSGAEARQAAERRQAEQTLLAANHGIERLRTRLLLALSRRFIPLRVEAKAAFMQMFDVARASARVIGVQLAAEGRLEAEDDVFYLTLAELRDGLPIDCASVVKERRALRQRYLGLELPLDWVGMPVPARAANTPSAARDTSMINALGVSGGRVEGVAKVVIDPNDSDGFDPGDILICHTTDPSWSSHFFIASAVVIDIGGALSHGAIVARELGIPCVINTQFGTQVIRSGDRVAVDGDEGTVEIRMRAGEEIRSVM